MSRAECEAANTSTLKQISRSIGTAHGVDSGGEGIGKLRIPTLLTTKGGLICDLGTTLAADLFVVLEATILLVLIWTSRI